MTTAAAIADSEMEGFRAIKYSYLGLTAAAVTATDSTYKSSTQSYGAYLAASSPTNQANSMVIYVACGTAPCTTLVPTKTVAGADGKNYRVDTYITWQTTSTAAGVAGRDGEAHHRHRARPDDERHVRPHLVLVRRDNRPVTERSLRPLRGDPTSLGGSAAWNSSRAAPAMSVAALGAEACGRNGTKTAQTVRHTCAFPK